jgi:hypothetical protein
MIARCTYPTHPAYHLYGGRGIKICERWLGSFVAFLEDMGDRPDGKTLERLDGNKGYDQANCCWADRFQQAHNRKSTRFYDFMGQKLTLAQAMKQSDCKLSKATVYSRIWKGMSLQEAMMLPTYEYQRRFTGPRAWKDRI